MSDALAVIGTRRTMKELVDGTIRVQIDIDPQYRTAFLEQFSEIDIAVGLVRLSLDQSSRFVDEKAATRDDTKPYGKEASELYRLGFFLNPKVLAAIGTDDEFLAWIRQQPCAMSGDRDYNRDEATGETHHRCEAAHVRRVAMGAGTAEKPPYSAIPLVHRWHDAQTRLGERVFDTSDVFPNPKGDPAKGREWMEKQRARHVVEWASHLLAQHLGAESMGYVPPDTLYAWAAVHDLTGALPRVYQEGGNYGSTR